MALKKWLRCMEGSCRNSAEYIVIHEEPYGEETYTPKCRRHVGNVPRCREVTDEDIEKMGRW